MRNVIPDGHHPTNLPYPNCITMPNFNFVTVCLNGTSICTDIVVATNWDFFVLEAWLTTRKILLR